MTYYLSIYVSSLVTGYASEVIFFKKENRTSVDGISNTEILTYFPPLALLL